MRDYPLGLGDGKGPGGRIRRLRDTDGDGRADESVVFAEGLSYPTSITPWRGGVLVAAPPEIIYLEDADGDGVAEVRRTVAAGFPLGVTDSNFNGLRFGPDGRIHGVNAGNAGRITSPLAPQTAPVDLGRLDFSLDPDTGKVATTVETGGGFGLVFDEWGRSFTAHNREFLMQRVVPQRYLDGIPSSRWLGPIHHIHCARRSWHAIVPDWRRPDARQPPGTGRAFLLGIGDVLFRGLAIRSGVGTIDFDLRPGGEFDPPR